MVKVKNTLTTSVDVWVIRETVTTLAPGEEKDIAVDPTTERIEIKPTP
ncbi:MAG: hypothetical protein QXI87_08105 [Thermoproteota archaeon]